jgi:hypothetical protein
MLAFNFYALLVPNQMASTTNKMCSRFAYVTLRINYSSSNVHFEKTSQSHLDIKVEDLVFF